MRPSLIFVTPDFCAARRSGEVTEGGLELEERQRPPLGLDFYCGQQFKSGNPNLTAAGNPNIPQLHIATSARHRHKSAVT
jgi:hypothetical protein